MGSLTGLVLAGGGVRGAYEAGVLAGLVDVLRPTLPSAPFQIFAGTSVGAINATFLASRAAAADMGIDALLGLWTSMSLDEHLKLDPTGLLSARSSVRAIARAVRGQPNRGRSVLDARPLARLVATGIDFDELRRIVASGQVHAVVIAALEIASGRTTIFVDHPEPSNYRPSMDPKRRAVRGHLTLDHVLASAALPLLFPARRIGSSHYVDGGLRFNTPIASAIRAGAERLVVISPTNPKKLGRFDDTGEAYPGVPFLLGKLINALLLDPLTYDLQVLKRFNDLRDVLEEVVPAHELRRVDDVLVASRGAPYRKIDTLVFVPSQDIGHVASDFVENHLTETELGAVKRWILRRATRTQGGSDSDFASYLLFDGRFAQRLIDMGRRDALDRRDEIEAFFQSEPRR